MADSGHQRIAERLAAARGGRFVGRRSEQELLGAALLAAEPPFVALFIHGPGGVGKTTLLHAYARLAAASSRPALYLDAHQFAPTPPAFLAALAELLGREDSELEALVAAWPERGLLLLDTYERLAPLDGWLRERFLPLLPAHTVVVIAARTPPAPAWRGDLAWADLTRTLALGNLLPDESRAYLAARGVPGHLHADVQRFTHGHPLALALVADMLREGEPPPAFDPGEAPAVVQALLDRLIQDVPDPRHRQALDVCALLWATTEALLAEVLEGDDAPALFAWLRGLPFVEQGPAGLFPHDLARETLLADLRWRRPAHAEQLARRLVAALAGRLASAGAKDQGRLWLDLLALTRHHPAFRAYFDWEALGAAYAAPAAPADQAAILAMAERHEGPASARVVAYWLRRQPGAFLLFRASGGAPIGFLAHLTLTHADSEECAADPAVAAAWAFVEHHGPLRAGEQLRYLRFWMGDEAYQGVSPALNLAAIESSIAWTTTPRLAWGLVAAGDPDAHAEHFHSIQIRRAPAADFSVEGRSYGVFARDWRVETVAAWLSSKVSLASSGATGPPTIVSPPPNAQRVVLGRAAFDEAVRQALRDYTRPDRLAANALLQTRLVAAAEEKEAAPALQALLRDALAGLAASPREQKLHRALWHTYIEPAPTQERAAERLGLPFNTYRYQLARGVARVAEWLWQRELAG